MALSTASWHLARLGVPAGATILISGAGTTIGYAAVQIALTWGAWVIAQCRYLSAVIRAAHPLPAGVWQKYAPAAGTGGV